MTLSFSLPPIIERELRVASRRGATYWSRVGAAASGMIIVCWVLAAQLAAGPAAVAGQITFRLLAGIAALTVVGSVLQLSSAAFAREKREDTLGLLFLTPLKPIDLVLGKLVSTSLVAFYRFLAIVPLLALPMLIGGVTAENFILLVLSLINCVFLGATLGLYVSARNWDEKRAATMATSSMFWLALLPVFAFAFAKVLRRPGASSFFAISPAYPIWQATVAGTTHSGLLWASLLWTQILGWILFLATCRALPRCWQNRPVNLAPTGEHLHQRGEEEGPQPSGNSSAMASASAARALAADKVGRSVHRQFSAQQRNWLLDQNPIVWLAMRWRPGSSGAWILGALGLVACVIAGITGRWEGLISPGLALFVCFCVNVAFKIHASAQASLAFARDRGEDPLQLLLATPITPRELVHGHMLALRQTLRTSSRRALWFEAVWLAFTITIAAQQNGEETFLYVLASVAVLGFLIPDLHALAWTALWRGVISRNAREAEHEANGRILLLPWLPTFLVWAILLPITRPFGGMLATIISWMIFGALANWWFARHARHNLETQLGLWALRRSAGEFEHYDRWRRLGRWLGYWWRRQFQRR